MFLKNLINKGYDMLFKKNNNQPQVQEGKTDLYDVLSNSYKPNSEVTKDINGYKLDDELSNDNHKVYFNPNETENKKLLITYRGTKNLDDVKSDLYHSVGKLRDTDRYDKSVDVVKTAKGKYKQDGATLTGHSLGSSLASSVATDKDKVIGYNQGNGLFGSNFNKKSKDETQYRTSGDLISLLGKGNSKTLNNNNPLKDFLSSHSTTNLKNKGIFI